MYKRWMTFFLILIFMPIHLSIAEKIMRISSLTLSILFTLVELAIFLYVGKKYDLFHIRKIQIFLNVFFHTPCFSSFIFWSIFQALPNQTQLKLCKVYHFHGLYFLWISVFWHLSRKKSLCEVCYRGQYLRIHILDCLPHRFFLLICMVPILFLALSPIQVWDLHLG